MREGAAQKLLKAVDEGSLSMVQRLLQHPGVDVNGCT